MEFREIVQEVIALARQRERDRPVDSGTTLPSTWAQPPSALRLLDYITALSDEAQRRLYMLMWLGQNKSKSLSSAKAAAKSEAYIVEALCDHGLLATRLEQGLSLVDIE